MGTNGIFSTTAGNFFLRMSTNTCVPTSWKPFLTYAIAMGVFKLHHNITCLRVNKGNKREEDQA